MKGRWVQHSTAHVLGAGDRTGTGLPQLGGRSLGTGATHTCARAAQLLSRVAGNHKVTLLPLEFPHVPPTSHNPPPSATSSHGLAPSHTPTLPVQLRKSLSFLKKIFII